MPKIHYFAYGKNMSTKLLGSRVEGKVIVVGKKKIRNYCLKFNKLGKDGSGKANIEPEKGVIVEGVLFDLSKEQFEDLKKWEIGYTVCSIKVINSDGGIIKTKIFIAMPKNIKNDLKPKREYLQYLIDGANEHGLSSQYKQFLVSFECT